MGGEILGDFYSFFHSDSISELGDFIYRNGNQDPTSDMGSIFDGSVMQQIQDTINEDD